jgi:GAF domain-containing protein
VLNKKSPAGFNAADVAQLSAFATWATIAIQNARLFQQAGQARQLAALNDLALTLSSTLDLDTILRVGLGRAIELLAVTAGAIQLLDDLSQPLLFARQVSQGLATEPALAAQQEQALTRLAQLIVEQNLDQGIVLDGTQPTVWPGLGFETVALVPLKLSGDVRGVLLILGRDGRVFSDDEVHLLTSLARIIGLAAQNAIHYNQLSAQTKHLTYLNEVGTALTSSLELAHVLKVIIEGVNIMLETERTSVFLIEPDTNELVLRYSNEGDANIRLPAPWQGIAGWVATHDQPALVNNTLSDPRHLRQIAVETGYQAHSILCVPLKVSGEVIGVVEVLNKRGGRQFTHYHQVLRTHPLGGHCRAQCPPV